MVTEPPDPKELDDFWRNLLGKESHHNKDAAWLREEERHFNEKIQVKEQGWKDVIEEELDGAIRRIKNWKAPGIDQVHDYWFKHLQGLQFLLCSAINQCICEPKLIPKWITGGQTILLLKK
eukprot:13169948-Ditylum_brightwellii.AAC.1